ncbi:Aldo/keto reductase family oxidoreductase [Propionibacterium freudenreichii]|uniref:aldo/keto reductase n=1 Tax=Propionibacterium freudenreichii TaxID=1744 RepID=UPI0004A00B55|nr:aldo/keto reductase [Propionibacterium freudenreichii]AWY95560.1 Aldo/keto reductase family oxidoreductase [Propionibacterium freudenreichii]CDP47576.1 oxidoreductase [Propionibacterium freudenreichii subsp. freudenreichii]
MRTRRVGASGLEVSQLGLGTMTWGGDTDLPTATDLVTTFVGAGGTLVDTAPAYGGGAAEQMLGRIMRTTLNREDVVLATKAGFGVRDGHQVIDTSRKAMLNDLAGSLRRLRTDHVDLWQVHAWSDTPLDETLAALDQAVRSGMARYVGVCNYIGWQIGTAATWQGAVPDRNRLVSAQVEYSLLARRAEIEVVPALKHHEMGLFAWSPIGRGVLTGKYRTGTPRDSRGGRKHFSWFVEPYLEERSRAVTDGVARAAEGLGLTPAQVALLWVRDAPGVTAPLLGARTTEQLQAYLGLDDVRLPEPIIAALDDITGGPNQGRAPAHRVDADA